MCSLFITPVGWFPPLGVGWRVRDQSGPHLIPRIHENRKEMNTRYITEIVHTTPLLNPLFLPNLHTHAKRPLTFSATSNGVEAQAARDRDRASFVVAPQRHGRAPVTVNRAAE